ncbi:MAG: M56 family metallopeptidase [Bacteroidota bacterium]
METIFTYILKVNALILLFYLVYQVALSRETFYKHSRWFLLSGLLVSVVLPFITITKVEYYEAKRVISNSIENNVPQMVQISQEAVQEPMFTNQEILFLVYGIICIGFFIKTLFDFIKLFKIIKVSNSEKKDKLVYINTNLVHTPFSFFNYIVFNEELISPVELENIMKHEEAHSMQKHSFDTLLAQIFIILFWFNPIVWLYRKSIVQNLEFLADSYAISQVSDKKHYQKTMLKITLQPQNITIINTFNQSSIKKRIIMLNTNQSNKKNALKYAIVIPVLVAFIMLFQVKVIAKERFSNTFNEVPQIKSDQKYVIQSTSTDNELKSYSDQFKKEYKIDLNIKGVKRNADKEITAINITLNDNKGKKANHKIDGDEAIEPIYINVAKGKNNAYTFAMGINEDADEDFEITENEDIDIEMTLNEIPDVESIREIVAMEVPEMPEVPVLDGDFPTPPNVPNIPNAPAPPTNPNDKKAWAKFEKDMEVFGQKMKEGDWKKFEIEMKAFEEKMKSFQPNMKEFEEKMKVFEQKMELQGKKIEKRIERKIEKEMKNADFDDTKGPKGPKGPKKIRVIEKIEKE